MIAKDKKDFERKLESLPEECQKCEHLSVFGGPIYRIYCLLGKPFKDNCDEFLDRDTYRSRNKGKAILPVVWKDEYAYTANKITKVPYCPSCHEYAQTDEEGHCVFCGQPLTFEDDPREPDITVSYDKDGKHYELTEVGEYRHHWYSVDGKHILHTQNTAKHCEGELLKILTDFVENDTYGKLLKIGEAHSGNRNG